MGEWRRGRWVASDAWDGGGRQQSQGGPRRVQESCLVAHLVHGAEEAFPGDETA